MAILITTACMPSAGYMVQAMQADEIVIEAFETYTKQTCRNQYSIFGPNGRQTLSIPVIKANGNHTLTRDILISPDHPWQKNHWRSIETAYNNSPFFLYYQDDFIHFYENDFRFLLDLNTEILQTLLKILKLDRPVRFSESFEKTPADVSDLRTTTGAKYPPRHIHYPHYTQVFETRHGFIPGLSILDVIFNLGPETQFYLEQIK